MKISKSAIFVIFLLVLPIIVVGQSQQENSSQEMDVFIQNLMEKMTLEEKIGQLNLLSSGMAVTGPTISKNTLSDIKTGRAGGIFNAYKPKFTKKLQKAAVEETLLNIHLIIVFAVLYGIYNH